MIISADRKRKLVSRMNV